MSNNNFTDSNEFLQNETKKLLKGNKLLLVIGVVFEVVLIVYLSWLFTSTKDEFLNPKHLAQTAVGMLDENIPKFVNDLEKGLIAAAPATAEGLVLQIGSLFPTFRRTVENEYNESVKLLPMIDKELKIALQSFISSHKDEIKKLYEAHNDQKFAEYAVNGTFEAILSESKAEGVNLEEFSSSSLEIMNNILGQLKELQGKPVDALTPIEVKKIKLLASIFGHTENK